MRPNLKHRNTMRENSYETPDNRERLPHNTVDERRQATWFGRQLPMALALIVIYVTVLHYLIPSSNFVLHNILQRLYYIPIVWAAYSISRRAAILTAVGSAGLYLPHIFMSWGSYPAYQAAQVIEVVLYPVVGVVSSVLFEREVELRQTALGYARMAQFGAVSRSVIRSLKSPLKSMQGVLISLETSLSRQPGAQEFVRVLRSQVEVIADTRKNLIRLVERKRIRLARLDINTVADEFAQQVAPLMAMRGKTLQKRLPQTPLNCRLAPKQLLECLHQLVEEMTATDSSVDVLTLYTGESDSARWIGCSMDEIRLNSYYLSEMSSFETNGAPDYAMVNVINVMNSHFGTMRVRYRKGQLIEFILVLPRRLRLPWYLRAEVKKDIPRTLQNDMPN